MFRFAARIWGRVEALAMEAFGKASEATAAPFAASPDWPPQILSYIITMLNPKT